MKEHVFPASLSVTVSLRVWERPLTRCRQARSSEAGILPRLPHYIINMESHAPSLHQPLFSSLSVLEGKHVSSSTSHICSFFLISQLMIKVRGFLIHHKLPHGWFSPLHLYLDPVFPFVWNYYYVCFSVSGDLFRCSFQPGSWAVVVLLVTLSWQLNLADSYAAVRGRWHFVDHSLTVMHRLHEQRDQAAGRLNGGSDKWSLCHVVSPWNHTKWVYFRCHRHAVISVCIKLIVLLCNCS